MRNHDRKNKNMFQVRAYLKDLYSFYEKQDYLRYYDAERYLITKKLLEVLQFLINKTKYMLFMKSFRQLIISAHSKIDIGLDTDREIIHNHITTLLLKIYLSIL